MTFFHSGASLAREGMESMFNVSGASVAKIKRQRAFYVGGREW